MLKKSGGADVVVPKARNALQAYTRERLDRERQVFSPDPSPVPRPDRGRGGCLELRRSQNDGFPHATDVKLNDRFGANRTSA